jgi:hypothetical protein
MAAHSAPASLHDFMLAGHSASACDLSISVQKLSLDAGGLEQHDFRGMKDHSPAERAPRCCDDSVTMPAPTRFGKKSNAPNASIDPAPRVSPQECKRVFRHAVGLTIVKDESGQWSSGAEEREVTASYVAQLILVSEPSPKFH